MNTQRDAVIHDKRLYQSLCSLEPVHNEYQNPWFCVKNRGGYYTTEFTHAKIIVLPIVDSNHILMVRPHRPLLADSPLELPAGGNLENESLRTAIRRELQEETGIWIEDEERFVPQIPLSETPGRDPRLLQVYQVNLSMQEYLDRGNYDEDEIGWIGLFNCKDIPALLSTGRIYTSTTIAVLARYLLGLEDKGNHE